MSTIQSAVIRFVYEPGSLADVSATEFEAELYDALAARFPGACIDITAGIGRTWGEGADNRDITPEVRAIANDVFARLCG